MLQCTADIFVDLFKQKSSVRIPVSFEYVGKYCTVWCDSYKYFVMFKSNIFFPFVQMTSLCLDLKDCKCDGRGRGWIYFLNKNCL